MRARQQFGEILVRLKALNRLELQEVLQALRRAGRHQKIGQMARAMGLIEEEHILAALAVQLQLIPGIEHMTLEQILQCLESAEAPAG